ncbi:hypothetical protein AA0116_g4415 [Alternaria tenuissima]|nr:hypothetical protein AA0116_g4415 [Alternaria tenuissima]
MPGFTSFLLGHGRFSAAVQDSTPPESDNELETEASRKRRLQQELRRARQVSRIYSTVLTRKDTEQTLGTLKQLESDIDAQIESFHDMGVASQKKRREIVNEFTTRGQFVLQNGIKVLERFGNAQGPVQVLLEAFTELNKGVRDVVAVYQRQIKKPLGDAIKELGKALRRKDDWTDLE